MPTQAERNAATRRRLIEAGRELFGRDGYADTPIEALAEHAGVTRGALYHHFDDKRALFLAVFESMEEDLISRAARAAASHRGDPLRGLSAGARAFLEACTEPAAQRIVLIDAPAVLGWDTWREIDERYALGTLRAAVEHAIAAGQLAPRPPEVLAHLLLGAITEGALLIGRSPKRSDARAKVTAEFDALLEGLR